MLYQQSWSGPWGTLYGVLTLKIVFEKAIHINLKNGGKMTYFKLLIIAGTFILSATTTQANITDYECAKKACSDIVGGTVYDKAGLCGLSGQGSFAKVYCTDTKARGVSACGGSECYIKLGYLDDSPEVECNK